MQLPRGIAIIALALCLGSAAEAASFIEGDLARRAELGFRIRIADDQLQVARLQEESAAAAAGLRNGDVITRIDNRRPGSLLDAQARLQKHRGDVNLKLRLSRGGRMFDAGFTPPPRPLEAIPNVDSHYGVVTTDDGARLRSIVAVPAGNRDKLPAVFFVQWVSCGSLEYVPRNTSRTVFERLVQDAGWALIRVERSASGDSEGPACHRLDYDTELAHYHQAFKQMLSHPLVDARKVVIYGSSLGATLAPLLAERLAAENIPVAGVMVSGGGGVTYFERMLAFERAYLERRPEVDPASIHSELLERSVFYTEYLIKGRQPDRIAGDSKAMARVRDNIRGLGREEQYGRPFSWHQQAARHNFLRAWHRTEAPVLVVFNEFDQYESRHGHKMIVDMINRWRPGSATYVEQEKTGHSNWRFATIEAAYADTEGVAAPEFIAAQYVHWLKGR
ncbi:PDZ domain-containing protein [Exilibacterium tricleocarpae]|uniref:PDZ domain-containing protein n=1 Tax=Exilibacterium tricleocarpae TaxID=2591008 RepID=A0A545T3Q0_9GAMM|nr:PDZ domain-containing protein [Exilibacterium tricleocarpae]TQV71815.1 PDZ domain-containing protein [Exilibacterium tricleocarpae]